MKRSVGLLFFALTFVVFLLSCGISVTEGARLLKQNYDEEDAGDEIGEMNAMQRKTTKNEEDDDQAAIYAAKLEEEEIENTQLSNEEESELEQVEEEVAKEASEMSSSSSSSSSLKLPHRATAAKTQKTWNSRNQTIQTAGDFPRRKFWKKIEGWRQRFGKASPDNRKGKRRI